MADDEQFSLCWNNFNSNLSAGFHESLCRGDLVDVTLTAEGQFVKAHRLVLSVCSPYFRKMFTQMPANQHAFVFLKDVSHSALKDLIQFMYCGEVNVKQEALPAFISTAEALQIKGLTDGEPAPSQSPAKPSTPAPQQVIPGPSMTAGSPRVKQRSSTTTRSYKIESEDSGDDKSTQLQQTSTQQTSQQNVVQQTQKRPAQRSITPHTAVTSVKRLKVNDPLETTEQAQITVQTVTDSKTSTDDPEFIDLPIDLPTKSEPDYTEEAGEVEAGDQEATYVEDDSYGDMKYDESYFTENDEGGASGTSATVKAATGTFSESYVSDTGEQSTTEAQVLEIASYAPTSRGRIQLIYGGQPFIFEKVVKLPGGEEKKYWRCNQWWNQRCRSRVYTMNDIVIPLNRFHTHEEIIKRKKRVKKNQTETTTNVSTSTKLKTKQQNVITQIHLISATTVVPKMEKL